VKLDGAPDLQPQALLFLDFDGVLHPNRCPEEQLFCNLPLLATVLADFPQVGLVVSSSWRHTVAWEALRARFTPPLAGQLVGFTPTAAPGIAFAREIECERFVEAFCRYRAAATLPWWALDDMPAWFRPLSDRLIPCAPDRGFDEGTAYRLDRALRQHFGGEPPS
jgi:hypothetical protein